MNAQVVCLQKLTGKNIVLVAAKHNHREIASERGADSHIDAKRTGLNRVLRGNETAVGVANMAQALLDNAGLKTLRKDSVRALEIIFSLPSVSSIDHESFFRDALDWTDEYFQAPVISAIIHYDEAAPHCHVLVLPLVSGRMIGSDMMGNRTKLQALQSDFHTKVGQRYGLTRQAIQKRLNASLTQSTTVMVLNVIQANPDILRKPSVRQALHDAIANNPEPLMLALGLEMPKPKIKGTFVGIMTKPSKPERKQILIGFEKSRPIGFSDVSAPEKERTLSCVGFAVTATPISPAIDHQTNNTATRYNREDDSGEFDREAFEERAAILEYGCGLSRIEAELRAAELVVSVKFQKS